MGLLVIILIVIGILIVLELFKHHFTKGLMKYLVVGIVLIFLLLVASAYIDFGELLGEGSTFASTGQVIAEGVSDDLEDVNIEESETLQTLSEKTKEFFQKILEN
ncbi:MAG: hypothetical protein Q8R18_00165 [bacterium]|nr:hypothetical protein [bacterium]